MVGYALPEGLLGYLSRNWWLVVLRGVAAVLFGLLALAWPGLTLVALAVVFGVYAIVDAAAVGCTAYRAEGGTRAPLVVQAVLTLIMGLIALLWPLAAVIALVFIIGAWAIVTGIGEIVTAVRLRAQISSEWLLIFVGALSVIFGLLLWFWPLQGAEVIVFVIGVYAIIFGVVLAVAGFRLRSAAGLFDWDEDDADRVGRVEEPEYGADAAGAAPEYVSGEEPGPVSEQEFRAGGGPGYGEDLLAGEAGEAEPTETFEPGERFEHPRRPGDEAPESTGASAFSAGPAEEEAEGEAPKPSQDREERPRRGGRHRAPKRDD
ncbi:HdeD family acid-resistance protein [Nocardiopsis salina]|uniref:HdeD family acid-resistance protein n=1 Tax=Nocardiopsis salina TaxID=245836 RepID=UPI00034B73C3|nr:HdeD family acid-resistance protein [Nocardiopsis salina]